MKATVQALIRWGSFATALGPIWGTAHGQWQSLAGGVSNPVRTFSVDPNETHLLVGGSFPWLNADSQRVNNIAAWDGTEWSSEGTGGGNGNMWEYGTTDPVLSLVNWHDTLYTGFLSNMWQMDPGIRHAAYLADDIWHAFPAQPSGGTLFAMLNGRLFMGGNSNYLDTVTFPGLCEINGGEFVPLPGIPFNPHADIVAFEYWHNTYYFGGITYDELGSRNIVSYDGMDQWSPLAEGIGGNHINCIRGYGDSLYVGGFFNPGPNVESRHIQIWDGAAWHPFFPEQVEFVSQVFDMKVYDDALWICGNFQFTGDQTIYGILRFDGQQLCAIGGPINPTDNNAIAFFQNNLYMAVGYDFPGLEYEWIGRLPLEGLVPDECVEVTTGIATTGVFGNPLNMYPNPAIDEVTITGMAGDQGRRLEILDVLGRSVLPPVRINATSMKLDVAALSVGCYELRLVSSGGIRVKRFLKR